MKTVSFVKWKFNRMLAVGTLVMSVNCLVMLSGSVLVGNLLGGDALAGLNVCTPAFGLASFFATVLSVGTGLVFSRLMGAFEERRARIVFSQSLAAAVVLGLGVFAAMRFGGEAFLDASGVTGAIRAQAAAYWRWLAAAMALQPLVLLLEALVYADGDETLVAFAGLLHISGAIGLSALFVRWTGDAGGAAAGMALTMAAVAVTCCGHFLRRDNHLRFLPRFSARDFGATCAASMPDAAIYFCWSFLILVVNRFTVARFGQGPLPIVALAVSVVEFTIVFDGIGEALIPVGGMYAGEDNKPALRELANHAAILATAEGLLAGAVLFAFAPDIVRLYGIRGASAALAPEAVAALRTLACAMPFMGFLMMANTHYLVVRHIPFAVSVTVVKDFACPCLGVLTFASALGSRGLWIGFAAGYAVAAAYPFAFVALRYGFGLFPWLVARDDGRAIDFAVRLSERTLTEAAERISAFLNDRGVFGAEVGRIAALVRGHGVRTMAANPGSAVLAEYFVSTEEEGAIRLVLRDNGRLADGCAVASAADSCRTLNAIGCARTVYRFDNFADA